MKDDKKQRHEYVAFDGDRFTIEWYFDNNGKSISLEYLESLDDEEQVKLFKLAR